MDPRSDPLHSSPKRSLSGIVKDMQERKPQAYYAGIWANYLVYGLLWFPTQYGLCRPGFKRAPSWSWAAFDGAIQHSLDYDILCLDFTFINVQRTLPAQGQRRVDWLEGPGSLTTQASMKKISFLQLPPKPWKKPSGVQEILRHSLPHETIRKAYDFSRELLSSEIGWICFDESTCGKSSSATANERHNSEPESSGNDQNLGLLKSFYCVKIAVSES